MNYNKDIDTGGNKMKKNEFIDALAMETGLAKNECEKVFNATFKVLEKELTDNKEVAIPNFGTFKVTQRAEREGRNPATGETIHIEASKTVTFKVSSRLKESLNK